MTRTSKIALSLAICLGAASAATAATTHHPVHHHTTVTGGSAYAYAPGRSGGQCWDNNSEGLGTGANPNGTFGYFGSCNSSSAKPATARPF